VGCRVIKSSPTIAPELVPNTAAGLSVTVSSSRFYTFL